MSDSDVSDFRYDDSDSDAFVEPVKPTKKAPAKTAAPKATAKPAAKKAAPKKPLATKRNLPNDSISEDDFSMDDTPAKPKYPVEDDEEGLRPKGPAKSASEMYQKLSQLEHVLKRPDTYIGSVEPISQDMWVVDPETKQMVNRSITYVPGFFKIFDEILVNAADNKINDPSMDSIKVEINREKNQISVWNNGKGIPVEMHSKEKMMIPELIFGNLLTSSNYDDDQKKLTGGRNGYGAKLANIYSTEFIVETADKTNAKKYKQVFSKNMTTKTTPKITDNKKGEEYTKITFTPELTRFHMNEIDDDTNALLMKRVYDVAGTVKDLKVFLNGERLTKIKGFKHYVDMYVQSNQAANGVDGAAQPKPTVVYEAAGKRWEVAFAVSDGEFKQVSFCNAISTIKGGTHVDMIATQLANKLLAVIKKKSKNTTIKPFQIKSHMWIFVNALIENPAFDSQTKETLTLKSSAFGSKCELSDDFVKKVAKTGIIDNVLSYARFKQDQALKKTDGAKRSRVGGITKLEDANWAGGGNAKHCTLILTEGDSAKALAVSGLGAIGGRDNFGVFPLRGKLLNVREASHDQIMKNVEIQNIKKILGLKHNHNYTSVDSLRYGQLMIMTDQDHDGSHIKGLIINFLDYFYPSLLKLPDFLVEFITPIVKVWKGKQEHTFYTMPQYEEWKTANNDGRGWESKYYKGLGSSGTEDAVKYFSDLGRHRLTFNTVENDDKALIDMAFNKKKADDRKEWLRQFKPGTFLDHDIKQIPISDFVNKELILFSMADNIRSIPSVADGLKPGQRKVMFSCFKRNLKKEIKVSQLIGYVGENSAYHHGEQSLTSTIVGLAQHFVGSNNINLLEPNGQFGTRMQGGKDAASARYIFTNTSTMTRAVFHPADDALLNYLIEDGQRIEPEHYLPTVPLILVNGADGIGTGWSTQIPNYNPADVVDNLRRLMRGEDPVPMTPWFRGFKGTIERIDNDRYKVSGIAEKINDETIEITELPVRKWTQDFKEMIEVMTSGPDKKIPTIIKDYEEHHTDATVHFKLHMKPEGMKAAEAEGFDSRFKLTTTLATSNMVCFDLNGKIKKYTSPEEILLDFYPKRLEYYGLRKQHLADELNKQFERLSNQARFVTMIIKKEIAVSNKKKSIIVQELRDLKFRPFPKNGAKPLDAGEKEDALEEEEDQGKDNDYDYLLGMAIWSLTVEKVKKLLAERDGKEQELIDLLKLSPQDIWNQDLDVFMQEWESALAADLTLAQKTKPKTKAQAKRVATARKRAKGEDTDDSEDDFKPIKAASKPRAPAKPRAPKNTALFSTSTASSASASATVSRTASPLKRGSAVLSDNEEDIKPVTKKAALPRAHAKRSTVDIGDSDIEMDSVPASMSVSGTSSRASTTKPTSSRKATTVLEDSDDEVVVKTSKPSAKPAPKGKAAAKKPITVDSGSGAVMDPLPKPAPKSAVKKKAIKVEDSSSDGEVPKAKTAPKKAPAKGKPKKAESDFEEDSDDYTPPVRTTTARAGRAATKKKPTYVDLSDLDSDD
ncbi:hypothetical protein CspeluHIS016_0203090 [Cutaneotrichosporon spelunceum]|uniref:DNA topoisomerase 2 n=1 Tax=Cutaneotrichosporon spelunceum TaxID=1672016 RepID=A0AAD3YAP6_9TREE|nr:hypothetical protein CspeluHIS016_0203090 [Cutaneotrichosporon spelunceum]